MSVVAKHSTVSLQHLSTSTEIQKNVPIGKLATCAGEMEKREVSSVSLQVCVSLSLVLNVSVLLCIGLCLSSMW